MTALPLVSLLHVLSTVLFLFFVLNWRKQIQHGLQHLGLSQWFGLYKVLNVMWNSLFYQVQFKQFDHQKLLSNKLAKKCHETTFHVESICVHVLYRICVMNVEFITLMATTSELIAKARSYSTTAEIYMYSLDQRTDSAWNRRRRKCRCPKVRTQLLFIALF